jgi:cytochrome oxidase Cu insertion factor (SCO1/SenC/PrrC family)
MSKGRVRVLALLVAWLAVSAGAQAADVEDLLFDLQLIPLGGETPPAFTLESLDGKKVSLSDYRGKPVFLYFWASW